MSLTCSSLKIVLLKVSVSSSSIRSTPFSFVFTLEPSIRIVDLSSSISSFFYPSSSINPSKLPCFLVISLCFRLFTSDNFVSKLLTCYFNFSFSRDKKNTSLCNFLNEPSFALTFSPKEILLSRPKNKLLSVFALNLFSYHSLSYFSSFSVVLTTSGFSTFFKETKVWNIIFCCRHRNSETVDITSVILLSSLVWGKSEKLMLFCISCELTLSIDDPSGFSTRILALLLLRPLQLYPGLVIRKLL